MPHSCLNVEEKQIAMVLGTLFLAENGLHSGGIKIHVTWFFDQLHDLSKAGQPCFRSIPFIVPGCPPHLWRLRVLQSDAEPPPHAVILAQGTFWRLRFYEKFCRIWRHPHSLSSALLKLYRRFSQLLHVRELFYVWLYMEWKKITRLKPQGWFIW